jgi:hypothetical protein
MNDLLLLLALRWRTTLNNVRFGKRTHRIVGGALALGGALLFVALLIGFAAVLLGATRQAGPALRDALVARTFFFLFLFLLAGAVPFVSGVLFTPNDLPLLLASPVRPAAVIAARLLDAAFVASAQFLVIGLPLLLASGGALGLSWWGWFVFALGVVPLFLLLPAWFTAALLLVVARLIGVRRIRAAVAIASVLLAVGMCLVTVREFAGQATRAGTSGALALVAANGGGDSNVGWDLPAAPPVWIPSTWASDALLALAAPEPFFVRWIAPLAALFAATLACGAVGVVAGQARAVRRNAAGRGGGRRPSRGRRPAGSRSSKAVPVATCARAGRQGSALRRPRPGFAVPDRHPRHLVSGAVRDSRPTARPGRLGQRRRWDRTLDAVGQPGRRNRLHGNQHFGIVVRGSGRAGLLDRAPCAGRRGRLCSGQVRRRAGNVARDLRAAAAVLVRGVSCFLSQPRWRRWPPLCFACVALCGLAVGIAGLFPRFVFDNPAHRASLAALVWGFVGATAYVIVLGIILGGGAWLALQQVGTGKTLVLGLTALLFALFSLLTASVPLLLARGRLTGYAWEE